MENQKQIELSAMDGALISEEFGGLYAAKSAKPTQDELTVVARRAARGKSLAILERFDAQRDAEKEEAFVLQPLVFVEPAPKPRAYLNWLQTLVML